MHRCLILLVFDIKILFDGANMRLAKSDNVPISESVRSGVQCCGSNNKIGRFELYNKMKINRIKCGRETSTNAFGFINTNLRPLLRAYAEVKRGFCRSRKSVGVRPVNFLNTVLKVVLELKPASKPTERIVWFLFFGSTNKRLASATR